MDYYIGILLLDYETTKVYQHTNQSLVRMLVLGQRQGS